MKLAALPLISPDSNAPNHGLLVDTFGRIHRKCRISLTDKCNLRCIYCMNEDSIFSPESNLLSSKEIFQLGQVLYKLGIHNFRLTGGEPLLRKDIITIICLLRSIGPNLQLNLTTNGILLERYADDLLASGIHTLNISLDSLDEAQFQSMSKRFHLKDVLHGIERAKSVKFPLVKLNSVILRSINEDQIIPLARFALDKQLELRFIESMPIGANIWDRKEFVSGDEIIETLKGFFGQMELQPRTGSSPAEIWKSPQGGLIGIIASVTKPFCSLCDRLRLTADGFFRSCLFCTNETDIKPMLRPEPNLSEVESAIRSIIWRKSQGHEISSSNFVKPARTMHAIGG